MGTAHPCKSKEVKMKRLLITLTAALLWAQFSLAGSIGTTGAQFLRLGAGARAISLGEAYTAIAEDATAIYYNPAGLASIDNQEITGMYASHIADIKYGFIGYAQKIDRIKGGLGIGLLAVQSGKIKGYTAGEDEAEDFDASSYALTCAYGRQWRKDLLLGAGLKLITSRIEDEKANPGVGMDLGAIYRPNKNLQLGLRVQNLLASKMKFIEEKESLPISLNLGVAYFIPEVFKDGRLTLLLDLKVPNDNDIITSLGAECLFRERFAARLGYRSEADIGSNISVGLGLKHKNYIFDYAFLPYGDLDDTHRLSLGISF